MELTYSLSDIDAVAAAVLEKIRSRTVVALRGEMGAGKTTFIHALCAAMGVTGNISSPTFSIINQYIAAGGIIIYHMDLYRLKDEAEAIATGVEDCLFSGNTCLVEWPENAPGIFPEETLYLSIKAVGNEQRRVSSDQL